MRRGMNGTRSAAAAANSANGAGPLGGRQGGGPGTATRRATAVTDENQDKSGMSMEDDNGQNGLAGPVTARLKMLEKKYSQVLEMQAKFSILDKWLQQQFGVKMFPSSVVNMEKFEAGDPEDAENPFFAVYQVIQRVKFLEEKVKKLEARPMEDIPEPKPTSNYSSAHAFRNFRGGKVPTSGGGVKRSYVTSSPTTPKKAKLLPRPVAPSANYPFKPSVKILPRDPNMPSPIKKEKEDTPKESSSPTKPVDDARKDKDKTADNKGAETVIVVTNAEEGEKKDIKQEEVEAEKMETDEVIAEVQDTAASDAPPQNEGEKQTFGDVTPSSSQTSVLVDGVATEIKEEVPDMSEEAEKQLAGDDALPVLEDATADMLDEEMGDESGQEEVEEVEQKPAIPLEDEGGDVSGSEASVSSMASSSSKPRLSTRRRQAGAVASTSKTESTATEKANEDEKPVMYTARGRRHTVPRRYAEFTGHDNVVSILKSQQRAEKTAAAAGSSKGGRRQAATPTKSQDTPPKIKKMVKSVKTPSPKKLPILTDSDGEGEAGPSKKKPGPNAMSTERPPCVDALVERVMAREVDSDGMVVLAESYPNIYVNQQQLVTVIVRSNGKSTRLTRKMTTLVFEDSVLASASPFGTKYYKDRLPPEPLEAMVDFIADSGFEPHYSKKKIYMIVGQVCNEARAGRVSRKFMQPLEATPGSSQQISQEAPSSVPASPTPESSPQ